MFDHDPDIDYAFMSMHINDGAHTSQCDRPLAEVELPEAGLSHLETMTAPTAAPTIAEKAESPSKPKQSSPPISPPTAAPSRDDRQPQWPEDNVGGDPGEPTPIISSLGDPPSTIPGNTPQTSNIFGDGDIPEVLEEEPENIDGSIALSEDSAFFLVIAAVAAASLVSLLAGMTAFWHCRQKKVIRDRGSGRRAGREKVQPDLSETETTGREEEDGVVEVRMGPSTDEPFVPYFWNDMLFM